MLQFNDNCQKKVIGNLENYLPFPSSSFDSITAVFILNYIKNWQQLIKDTSSEKKFLTLSQKKPFTATYHDGNIVIKPSKIPVFERPINQKEFLRICGNYPKKLGEKLEVEELNKRRVKKEQKGER